jgi:excisionase family DNA binding protein
VKNNGKNQLSSDSFSVSEAATLLGVSTPTLKRMVQEGTLNGFRTPGGHLRVTAESIEAMKEHGQTRAKPVRAPSPVLQNRRERLEELTIQAQEHRARRELEKLQREDQEETQRHEAEVQAREEEAAQRQAELELERQRLEHEKAQERIRRERAAAEGRRRQEVERQLTAFHYQWQERAAEYLGEYQYRWLSATQRKEVLERFEAEIANRQPADEPRMPSIIARSLEALIEPLKAERDAKECRQKLTNEALSDLPYSATDTEKVKATAAIREVLARFDSFADACEMRVAAKEAAQPFRQSIERRLLSERLISWAVRELPAGRTDRDEARIRRESAEILAELPPDGSEAEGKEALQATVTELCQEIKKRLALEQRQTRKAQLIEDSVGEVWSYLLDLKYEGEIDREDYWDIDLRDELKKAVRRELQGRLKGDESPKKLREMVRTIVDRELR